MRHTYIIFFFFKFLFQTFKAQSPSPPSQLKDVLASSDLANEFHAYLADMDKTHDEYTKQTYLNFALKCNELRKADNIKEAENILNSMGAEFFSNGIRKKRLAIRNEVTRDECKKYLENKPDGSKIPTHLWDAETEAHSHLANHFQDFLNLKGVNPNLIEKLKTKAKDAIANLRGKLEL